MFAEAIPFVAFAAGCIAAAASIANLFFEIRAKARAKEALLARLDSVPELHLVACCSHRPSDSVLDNAAAAIERVLSPKLELADFKRIKAGLRQANKAHLWRYIDSLIGIRARNRVGLLGHHG